MKKILVSILLAVVLSIFAVSVIGCHGCGETSAERSDDHSRQLRVNGSMMIDDIDAILEQDRPSRLTEFTVR
ncbi:MAG: hypothetical protein WCE45_02225 [Sedimentisphaerales bacterium]